MKVPKTALWMMVPILVAACTDLKSVSNFAAESSIIAANKASLDNSTIVQLAKQHKLDTQLETTKFTDNQKVVTQAQLVLTNYMAALGKLTDGKLANVDSSVASVQASLKSLGALDAQAQTASASAQTLADWLITNITAAKAADMIKTNDPSVQEIATFLSAYSQTIRNDYVNLGIGVEHSYNDLKLDPSDRKLCPVIRQCNDTNLLIDGRKADDVKVLAANANAAAASVKAFAQIAADHKKLAEHTDSLDAADIKTYLQQNEPTLLNAIAAINKL